MEVRRAITYKILILGIFLCIDVALTQDEEWRFLDIEGNAQMTARDRWQTQHNAQPSWVRNSGDGWASSPDGQWSHQGRDDEVTSRDKLKTPSDEELVPPFISHDDLQRVLSAEPNLQRNLDMAVDEREITHALRKEGLAKSLTPAGGGLSVKTDSQKELHSPEVKSTSIPVGLELGWPENEATDDIDFMDLRNGHGIPLRRRKRDLNWSDVEEFYADKNNFAMYLVLPLIVLVYGGCAVIYCIARCRRYVKRKKKKPKEGSKDLLNDEPEASNSGMNPVVTNPNGQSREGAFSSSEVRVDMERNDGDTPLPWQVPGDRHPLYPSIGQQPPQHHQQHQFVNRGYDGRLDSQSDRITTAPPPYEESMHRNHPPPYANNKGRRDSIEEIIALEPTKQRPLSRQDRKRRRPSSRLSDVLPPLPEPNYDEEREKARQLVRGDRPRRDREPDQDRHKQGTPDIISHARTKPLTPKYRPPQDDFDGATMAKQAAQLLRLDHQGKQAGKKQKRLVFVAE